MSEYLKSSTESTDQKGYTIEEQATSSSSDETTIIDARLLKDTTGTLEREANKEDDPPNVYKSQKIIIQEYVLYKRRPK